MSYSELRKGRFSEGGRVYFVTTVTKGRRTLFTSFKLARLVIKSLVILEYKFDITIIAWVVMPDHIHLLIRLEGIDELSEVIKSLKSNSALAINRSSGRIGSLWQANFYDHALRTDESIVDVARYIIMNPVRAGLVKSVKDYSHWDYIYL